MCYVEIKISIALFETYATQEQVNPAIPHFWCLTQTVKCFMKTEHEMLLAHDSETLRLRYKDFLVELHVDSQKGRLDV